MIQSTEIYECLILLLNIWDEDEISFILNQISKLLSIIISLFLLLLLLLLFCSPLFHQDNSARTVEFSCSPEALHQCWRLSLLFLEFQFSIFTCKISSDIKFSQKTFYWVKGETFLWCEGNQSIYNLSKENFTFQ